MLNVGISRTASVTPVCATPDCSGVIRVAPASTNASVPAVWSRSGAARALCTKCGANSPEEGRRWCEPCLATRRKDDRARYEKAAASGLIYGGRDPERKRRNARAASKQAPGGPPGRRHLHALRPQSPRRGRHDVRALQGLETAGGTRRPMPPGDPPGCASGAAAATTDGASRCAPCSRCWNASAETRNAATRRTGRDIGRGARNRVVRTATRRARGRRGASRARGVVMRNPIISAGCRSILRPSPWCFSTPTSRSACSTTRWRLRRFSPSRSWTATGSRCWSTARAWSCSRHGSERRFVSQSLASGTDL